MGGTSLTVPVGQVSPERLDEGSGVTPVGRFGPTGVPAALEVRWEETLGTRTHSGCAVSVGPERPTRAPVTVKPSGPATGLFLSSNDSSGLPRRARFLRARDQCESRQDTSTGS
jgi:hypothetical protein